MDIREVFARNLRKARNAQRLSQEALAHEAGVDRTYVSALERGVYNATIVMVAKLAKALGVEPSVLLQRQARPRNRKASSETGHGYAGSSRERAAPGRTRQVGLTQCEGRIIEAPQRLKLKMKSQENGRQRRHSD